MWQAAACLTLPGKTVIDTVLKYADKQQVLADYQ